MNVFARRRVEANEGIEIAVSTARVKVELVLARLIHCTFLQSEDTVWFLIRAFKFTTRTSDSFFHAVSKIYKDALGGIARLIKGARLSPFTAPLSGNAEEVMNVLEIKFRTVCDVLNLRRCDGGGSETDMSLATRIQELSEIQMNELCKDDLIKFMEGIGPRPSASLRKAQLVQKLLETQENFGMGS